MCGLWHTSSIDFLPILFIIVIKDSDARVNYYYACNRFQCQWCVWLIVIQNRHYFICWLKDLLMNKKRFFLIRNEILVIFSMQVYCAVFNIEIKNIWKKQKITKKTESLLFKLWLKFMCLIHPKWVFITNLVLERPSTMEHQNICLMVNKNFVVFFF